MTPTAAAATLDRMLRANGEPVELKRSAGSTNQASYKAETWARVVGRGGGDEIGGEQIQGQRQVIIAKTGLDARQWPVPPRKDDKIILADGTTLNVEHVDEDTRRVQGVVIGYNITASG